MALDTLANAVSLTQALVNDAGADYWNLATLTEFINDGQRSVARRMRLNGMRHFVSMVDVNVPIGTTRIYRTGSVNPIPPSTQITSTLYASTSNGKIYKSIDSGLTWGLFNAGISGTNQRFVTALPDGLTVYAYGVPSGLYQSLDGGVTWAVLTGLSSSSVFGIAINPVTPTTLYAVSSLGVDKSTDNGVTWAPSNTGLTTTDARAIVINPTTPSILYVATFGGGVFKSIDSGATWTAQISGMAAGLQVVALAINPLSPTTIYAAASGATPNLYKSTNSGASWLAIPAAGGLYGAYLAIDPVTTDTLYVSQVGTGLKKSIDAGGTWALVGAGLPDVRQIAIDPLVPATIYAASFGSGVYKSIDSGVTFTASTSGISGNALGVSLSPTPVAATLFPEGLINPRRLLEKQQGSADSTLTEMVLSAGLPRRAPETKLKEWDWISDQILFIGATTARTVRIEYFDKKITNLSAGSDILDVPDSLSAVSLYAAGSVAASRGQHDQEANYVTKADAAVDRLCGLETEIGHRSLPGRPPAPRER